MGLFSTLGSIGGGVGGFALGGPLGGAAGAYLGNYLGGKLDGGGGDPNQGYNDQLKLREQGVFDQESALANQLQRQASGIGPSAAGAQLGMGLDQIQRNSLTQAAGVGGAGGVLARYAAMNNAAMAGAQANQAAALARINEINAARGQLGQVLGNQAGQTSTMYGTVTGAANAANANNIMGKKNDEDFTTKLLGSGLNGLSQYGAASAIG